MDEETFAWCLFQEADNDSSGGLDTDEIGALARNLGHPLSKRELAEAMKVMDEDGSGTVEFDEFYAWFSAVMQDSAADGWAARMANGAKQYMFECIAGDGRLSRAAL
eukprot:SAG31_NODE_520_length_14616_cov_8.879005_15_plen_107_part_00